MRGVVAAGHERTAEAGADALREGGDAFDAGLAAMAMAAVVEPVLCGPGGGGFMVARTAQGDLEALDFFVHTPRCARPREELDFRAIEADFGVTTQEFHIGWGAAATPGYVAGLCAIARAHGRLPLAEILGPAAAAARDGVVLTEFQAELLQIIAPIYRATASARAVYGGEGPRAMKPAGALMRHPDLADCFDLIAEEGARGFYEGEIAGRIARVSAEEGGHLTAEDLAGYRALPREPLRIAVPGGRLVTNPPPSAGGVMIAAALRALGGGGLAGPRLAAAQARANELRAQSADDPAAMAAALGLMASDAQAGGLAPRGTTHISAIDADGAAVAITLSNGEGSGAMVPGAGFMLNNMLGEEDLCPGGFHRWPPDRRLSSMMAPSLFLASDGGLTAFGTGGSNRIRSAMFQVAARLAAGQRLAEAIAAPRLHLEKTGRLSFEDFFPAEERAALLAAYDDVEAFSERSMFFGGVHGAARPPDAPMEASGSAGFGIYVHWPWCLSKCPYCDFNSHVAPAHDEAGYVAALLAEIDWMAARSRSGPAGSVFFGGGTPSLMAPASVAAILERIAKGFGLEAGAEVTLEANPTSADAGRFAGYRAAGVNRLSLGLQALDDAALSFLGRTHSAGEGLAALDLARARFERVSIDLIYARRGQGVAEWERELARALALGTGHLSLYQLTIEAATRFGDLAARGRVLTAPDEAAAEMYELTQAMTEAAGRPAYEISNHARPGEAARHNLTYWRGGDWAGVGPGAHGRLATDRGRRATATIADPALWARAVAERGHGLLSDAAADEAAGEEYALTALRLAEGLSLARYRALGGREIADDAIAELAELGLITREGARLRATMAGRLVLNRVLARLLGASR